jgi:hypothetical protein
MHTVHGSVLSNGDHWDDPFEPILIDLFSSYSDSQQFGRVIPHANEHQFRVAIILLVHPKLNIPSPPPLTCFVVTV